MDAMNLSMSIQHPTTIKERGKDEWTYIRSNLRQNNMHQPTHNIIAPNLIESAERLESKLRFTVRQRQQT